MTQAKSRTTSDNDPAGPRSVRINKIDHLGNFVRSWNDCAHPRNAEWIDLRSTPFGNINRTGIPGNYLSHVLSRWHPKFAASLELGIRELVLLLIKKFDWITYSSCEGHHYAGLEVPPVERRVGILPRSRTEAESINAVLRSVAVEINEDSRPAAACVTVVNEAVESELGILPVIVLCFQKRHSESWQSYFELIDSQYNAVIEKLSNLSIQTTTAVVGR
jgi:uncharacterized protein